MNGYMTEQRRELLSFFRDHPDRRFTARQVAQELINANISISAIYRNLSKLEQDGYLSRTVKEGSRESLYQCVASEHCRGCIHLNCTVCGSTFHLDTASALALLDMVRRENGFEISREKTVIYGVCEKCRGNGK